MVDGFARGLQDLAEAGTGPEPETGPAGTPLGPIVAILVNELHHGEAWKRLLARARPARSPQPSRVPSCLP